MNIGIKTYRIHVLDIKQEFYRAALNMYFFSLFFLAPKFQCCYFCESSCLFYLSFMFLILYFEDNALMSKEFSMQTEQLNV